MINLSLTNDLKYSQILDPIQKKNREILKGKLHSLYKINDQGYFFRINLAH